MFDLRYHVASLAAVFIAIAIGVVIGVAIASGGEVDQTTQDLLRAQRDGLQQELEAERESARASAERRRATVDVMEQAYPALMADRLADTNVAVLFLGPVDGDVRSDIEHVLTAADAGGTGVPLRVTGLELPVDAGALEAVIAADPALAAFGTEGGLAGLGQGLGRELVSGGEAPVLEAVDDLLVEERVGSLADEAAAVVVVRSWIPDDEADEDADARAAVATEELVDGLLQGLGDEDVPVVGVERFGAETSSIDFFRDEGVSTVDNVDTLPGRVALAVLLAGGQEGHYGTKESASNGVAPPIEPVAATIVG